MTSLTSGTRLTSGTPAELYFLKCFILSYPRAKKKKERERLTLDEVGEGRKGSFTGPTNISGGALKQMYEMCYYQIVNGLVCHIWLYL